MAINSTHNPPSAACPTSSFRIAIQISEPKPCAPINVAKTTRAKAIIIVWLMPIIILGKARGACTLNKICVLFEPNAVADSIVSLGTCRIPKLVNLIIGGIA